MGFFRSFDEFGEFRGAELALWAVQSLATLGVGTHLMLEHDLISCRGIVEGASLLGMNALALLG